MPRIKKSGPATVAKLGNKDQNMNKRLSLVLMMMLFAVSPLLAAFCHNCGKELPSAANFCPACGKPSAGALEPAPVAQQPQSAPQQPPVIQPVVTPQPIENRPVYVVPAADEASLADYDSINQMELLLSNASYGVASRQAGELRRQHEDRMVSVERNYRYFSQYRRKLHDLHLKKLRAIENYLEAWKGTEYGPDRVRAQAEKDRALFVLSQTNEAIDTLLTGGGSLSSISRVEEMEQRLTKTSSSYVVTAPYLMVENFRLSRGEPLWIIDVVSASAKVLHMGRSRSNQPVCGWVSVYDLEKRSNWRSDPAFFYSPPTVSTVIYQPAPEPPVKVVIVSKGRYPYRHRDRHDHDRRDRDRHDYDRRDKDHGRHDDHRRYDYVVIKPRFW